MVPGIPGGKPEVRCQEGQGEAVFRGVGVQLLKAKGLGIEGMSTIRWF